MMIVVQFQIEANTLTILTDAGRLFRKPLRADGIWEEMALPVFPEAEKKETDLKAIGWDPDDKRVAPGVPEEISPKTPA